MRQHTTRSFSGSAVLPVVGLVAAVLMTRMDHFGTAFTPPDATLASFFLAGLWVRRAWMFPLLLGTAALADQWVFSRDASGWCFTAAYAFLIPAYACVWWAGRTSRGLDWRQPAAALRGAGLLLLALLAASFISKTAFFLLSGHYAGVSWVDYWRRTGHYVLPYVGWPVAYVCIALCASEMRRVLDSHRAPLPASPFPTGES